MSEQPRRRAGLKIGYVWQSETTDFAGISATALHIRAVVRSLQRRGHQVRLVSYQSQQVQWTEDVEHWHAIDAAPQAYPLLRTPPMEKAVRRAQATLRLPYLRLFDSLRFADSCAAALAGFDLLYERYWLMNYGGVIAARRLNVPIILEVNGDVVEEYAQLGLTLSRSQWALIGQINRRLFRQASHVVAVSEPLRARLIERWQVDPDKVSVAPNGADLEVFGAPRDRQEIRRRYRLGEAPVVIFVGTFKPWHGLDLLLAAFRLVASALPAARLVLAGDGPLRKEIDKQIEALNLEQQVIRTGMVAQEEAAELLWAADVAVIPSAPGGASTAQSPLKLFEYMAAGRAIVAPLAPNIEQVVAHGQTAILVEPGNPAALAEAVQALLADPGLRRALGQAARQQALEKHSWDQTAAQLETIASSLVHRPAPDHSAAAAIPLR